MKGIFKKALLVSSVLMSLVACGKKEEAVVSNEGAKNPADFKGTVKVWSFTNEVKTLAVAFQEKYPNVKVEYTMIPMTAGEYQQKLQQSLATGADVPDVVVLEAAFAKQYVESDYLKDLSHLKPLAEKLGTFQFVLDMGTNKNGEIKAYGYQATPGAMVYRRSMAKEVFGTDEPAKIQEIVKDQNEFLTAARTIKEKTNGTMTIVPSSGDLLNAFLTNRKDPWVVDNKLTIDPMVKEYFDFSKNLFAEGLEAKASPWSEGWFAGMSDSLKDAKGNQIKVFSYFLPTWGIPYVLMPNAKKDGKDTSGDWAMIQGPLAYNWGGTYMGVAKAATSPDLAEEFIKFSNLDEDTLTKWATGKYTNEMLKKIDPSIGDQGQGAGDFVSSKVVVDKITAEFDKSETSGFIGGQNIYKEFGSIAPNISLKLTQGSDDLIQRTMQDYLSSYVDGKLTYEEALKEFKVAVKNVMPKLNVE